MQKAGQMPKENIQKHNLYMLKIFCFLIALGLLSCSEIEKPVINTCEVVVDRYWISEEDTSIYFAVDVPQELIGANVGIDLSLSSAKFSDIGYYYHVDLNHPVIRLSDSIIKIPLIDQKKLDNYIVLENKNPDFGSSADLRDSILNNLISFNDSNDVNVSLGLSLIDYVQQIYPHGEDVYYYPLITFTMFHNKVKTNPSKPKFMRLIKI